MVLLLFFAILNLNRLNPNENAFKLTFSTKKDPISTRETGSFT